MDLPALGKGLGGGGGVGVGVSGGTESTWATAGASGKPVVPELALAATKPPETSKPAATSSGGSHSARRSSRASASSSKGPHTARPAPKAKPESASAGAGFPGSITPAQALRFHAEHLTEYEQGEILEFKQVYCIGSACRGKVRASTRAPNNHGFDDDRGDYKIEMRDHLGYRFEVMEPLGKGSFGQVVKCIDHKTGQSVAVKVIRNKKRFHHQALVEVKLLTQLRDKDPTDAANIIHIKDSFYFRHHLCISFPLLSIDLYAFVKSNNFQGVSLGLIRRFAIQLLTALRFLRMQRIVHCDLKPENILLKQSNKSGIKVIDFGSSCLENERVYTYIQSRFYRAPEVILGCAYSHPIDIWSFGCILAELLTGYPLFPGENEAEQFACIMEVLGLPPDSMVSSCTRHKTFFEPDGAPRIVANSRGRKRRPGSKDIASALRCNDANFVSFLAGCLRWDPAKRFTPDDAFQHPWIQEAAVSFRGSKSPRSTKTSSRSSFASSSISHSTHRRRHHGHGSHASSHHSSHRHKHHHGSSKASASRSPRAAGGVLAGVTTAKSGGTGGGALQLPSLTAKPARGAILTDAASNAAFSHHAFPGSSGGGGGGGVGGMPGARKRGKSNGKLPRADM